MIRELNQKIRALLPKTRKSHPISKLLRPVFEMRKIKTFIGAQIAAFSLLAGVSTYPTQAYEFTGEDVQYIDAAEISAIVTEETFEFPVEEYRGTSQGYGKYHPGVDLRAPVGAKIHPVTRGKVIKVEYLRYGYGHYVVIEHDKGLQTLYAHMEEVLVSEGDELEKKSVIGTVGMTGLSTGPHLHLEMVQESRYLSPQSVL